MDEIDRIARVIAELDGYDDAKLTALAFNDPKTLWREAQSARTRLLSPARTGPLTAAEQDEVARLLAAHGEASTDGG
jgi:hypothetical protein